jgi:hypothetical protein
VCEPGTVRWIVVSVAMSVVLTALLNIGLRAFPDAGRRAARGLAELTSPDYDGGHERDRRLRVFVPWKAMIVGSVILTIVVNLVLRVI